MYITVHFKDFDHFATINFLFFFKLILMKYLGNLSVSSPRLIVFLFMVVTESVH